MIELKHISAGYPGKPVLEDISLEFLPGQVLILLGPNGSGKSTLLKTALGLLPAARGQVLYDGVDIRSMKPKAIAQKAAYLTQGRNTPNIQALSMVLHGRFPYLSYPRQYRREDYAIARQAMDTAGCREYEDVNVSRLSGGQRQSVYLAMALAQDTDTVFLDEPTTYLDVSRQMEMLSAARSLADKGKAVVLILHDIPLALRGADRVAVLREGRLAQCGSPEEVWSSGVLDRVFDIRVHRVQTPHGAQYYCTPKEE